MPTTNLFGSYNIKTPVGGEAPQYLIDGVPIGGGGAEVFRYISAGGETQTVDDDRIIFSGGPYSFELIDTSSWNKSTNLVSKDSTITINAAAGNTILGQSSYALTAGEVITIGPDGANIIIVG